MAVVPRPHPAALPHGPIREVLPDVFIVTGTVTMAGRKRVRFSRNMTIVREAGRLVLVNSVRLDDAGLAALDAVGKVTDVVRIAAAHGQDDPFYRERYGAKVWAVAGQRYTAGFDPNAPDVYFEPDEELRAGGTLPLTRAHLHVVAAKVPEGLLLLDRAGGTVVAGDCLQNWDRPDAYFSFLGSLMARLGGFIRPYNVGPGWLRFAEPPKAELRAVLDLPFENVLPAHGTPVLGDARARYRRAIERVS